MAVVSILVATVAFIQGAAVVTDADTLMIGPHAIRLESIDAPEKRQHCILADGSDWSCGESARKALSELVSDRTVACEISGDDRYHRALGTCRVGKININRWLVQSGWAVAYRRYSTLYARDEALARVSRKNLWASQFDMPWQWRANARR